MNRFLISILIAVAAAACNDHDQFRISGTIEEEPTMNIRVGYYADGVYRTLITVSEKGAFEFYGSSRQPTVVEIYDYEYRLLGRVYAANGQTLDVKLARSNPYHLTVDGNETAKAWADFLRANADSLRADNAKANNIIGRYIAANPASTVSTLLLLTSFDSAAEPLMADSLLGLIAPEARPSALTDGYNYLLQRVVADCRRAGAAIPIYDADRQPAFVQARRQPHFAHSRERRKQQTARLHPARAATPLQKKRQKQSSPHRPLCRFRQPRLEALRIARQRQMGAGLDTRRHSVARTRTPRHTVRTLLHRLRFHRHTAPPRSLGRRG